MTITKSNSKGHSKFFVASILEEIKKPITLKFPVVMLYKIISSIQILALILDISAGFFQSGVAKTTLLQTIRFFIFRKLFVFTDHNAVTGVAFIICWFIVFANIIMLGIVLVGNKLNIRYMEKLSAVLRHYMVLYQFCLFLPIFVFLLEFMQVCRDRNTALLGSTNDSVFFTLCLILAIFNFFISLMNLKCFSALYAQKTFTKRNSNLATLDLIFKTFMAVYLVFVENSTAGKWIAISVSIIYGFLVFQTFHRQLPFFQIKVLEAYCMLLGAQISLITSIFVCGIFDEFWEIDVPDLPVAGFLLTLPFCMVGQKYRMIATIRGCITFNEKNMRTENDVFIHLLALRVLFKKGAEISIKHGKFEASHWNMKLSGVISRHHDHCENTSCGCRTFLETEDSAKGISSKKEKYKDLEVTLMRELYEKGIEKVPHSEAILLNLAQFYLLYLENYLRSYLVLQAFEKKSQKSFETEIMVDYLKKRVQERMELKLSGNGQQGLIGDYETNNLNVTALVQNDILFIQLKKFVHEQVSKQLKFWDLLENFELNTRAIETCCEEIDLVRNKIEKLWDNLSKINQKCMSHFMLYGLYQTLVNNTTKKGEKLLNDYTRMHGVGYQDKEGITNDNLYDALTVVVRISMRRDKIGMIEECSGDVDALFGYQSSELLDNNVATIMSTFFKERHHTFIMNHFELGTENVLNKVKRLYGYHREGYIFPIFLYVSIYPNIETGLSYMGIMRPRNVYNNYILLKSDGTVDSYSPEIAEYLGLESRKKYNITEICPSFEKIMNAFNYVTKNRYTDLLEEVVEYRAEGVGGVRKSNEYQVKVSHIESDKDLVKQTEEAPLKQKELSSMIGGEYENASSLTAQSKMMATMDTREETGITKSKDRGTPGKSVKVKQSQKKFRRLNTDDIEEYKKVFDQMSVNGAILSFNSQREKTEGTEQKNYLCTVADEIFDHSILRIITMGRNDENIEEKEADSAKNTRGEAANPAKEIYPSSSKEQTPQQSREHSKDNSADQDDIKDIGISDMPFLFENSAIFNNPFDNANDDLERKNSSNKEKPVNKEAIFSIVSHNPAETQENQLELSSNRNDVSNISGPGGEPKLKETHTNTRNHTIHFTEAERSGNSKENQEGFNEEVNDSKEFIQEMVLNNNFLERNENSTTTGSTMSMRGGIISKFEALLYKKEEGKTSNKLKSYYLIIGICLVMAILNTVLTNSNLSNGSQKVQKALSVGRRVDQLLLINYNTRIVDLYLNSYITANRHTADMGITDFADYSLYYVKTYAEALLEINSEVMNDIEGLYKSSQSKFFTNYVTLNYPSAAMQLNNVGSLSSFEAVDTLALAALETTSGSLASLTATSDNIAYLLLNTMNELYLEMRNGFNIYQDDLEDTLSNTKAVTLGIAIAVLSVYVLFMVILVRDLSSTHQDKVRFWNSLVKLDTQKGVGHKKMLHIFKENLENSSNHSQFKKALMDAKKHGTREVKVNKAKEAQINGFKRLKGYKLKNRSYFIVFPFLIVLLLILAYFIISEVSVANEVDNKRIYMEEIVRAESYYQLNMITLNGLYQYIAEGSATSLQGTTVVTAINENLSSLSRLGDFVASFRTKNDFDPKGFIQMNLCETYFDNTKKGECVAAANGMVTNGLMALLTFTKQTLDNMMDLATQSTGTTTEITTALDQDNLKQLESVLQYLTQGFYLLAENLANNEDNEQDNFQVTQIVILLVFLSVLLMLNYFMVWKGFRRLDGQKFDNMKILRVIPAPLILESKMIKTYLLKSFKDDLSSITNKI